MMHVLNLAREMAAARDRSRRTIALSFVAHALLVGWLLVQGHLDPAPEGIVEITWFEAVAPEPPPLAAKIGPRPEEIPITRPEPAPERKFLRRKQVAEREPTPQDLTANRDKVTDRLDELRPSRLVDRVAVSSPAVSGSFLKSAAAAPTRTPSAGSPVDLKRAEATRSEPVSLTRGPAPKRRPTAAAVAVPVQMPPAAVEDLATVSRRTLEGADLSGEVADRPIISHTMPAYPEWAKTQAVEATVTLYFVVLPDGRIKENVQIQKTAGFSDFDRSAITALRQWRFRPLTGGATREQWGTITFRYRLRD